MISRILWNRKFITAFTREIVFYCPERDLSSPYLPTPLFKIYFNVTTHLSRVLSRGLLPLIPPTKSLYVFPFSAIRVSLTAHFTVCELITMIMFAAEWKSKISALCNFLHLPKEISTLRFKERHRHSSLRHSETMFLRQIKKTSFKTVQKK